MKRWAALVFVWSAGVFAADEAQYLVVREKQAEFKLPPVDGAEWSAEEASDYRPPLGRVLKGFELLKSGDFSGSWDVLLDDGKGRAMNGYLSAKSVAAFPNQLDAEKFAEQIDIEAASVPLSSKEQPTSSSHGSGSSVSTGEALGFGASTASSNPRHSGASRSIPWKPAPRAGSEPSKTQASPALQQGDLELDGVKQDFLRAQKALRKKLGNSFLAKLGKSYVPSASDRRKILKAADSLDPKDRAVFGMIATAWAEERESVGDKRCQNLTERSAAKLVEDCRNDSHGRANMLFTMKIVDNRSEPRKSNNQYMAPRYWNKGKLERMWGVMTKDRMFSSWNAGSANFGNMLSMVLGEAKHMPPAEHVALERAMRAYHDIVSGRAVFEGFVHGSKLTTHMLNPPEVREIVRDHKNPRIVSWSMERVFNRHKKGLHQGGLRVPKFSISFPVSESSTKMTTVPGKSMGHWPVYMDLFSCTKDKENVARTERLRIAQGAW